MGEYYVIRKSENTELYHHGVKGMKWGVRRFQKKDGSLTSAGAKRYSTVGDDELKVKKQEYKSAKKEYNKAYNKAYNYSARHPISQFASKKRIDESDKRWEDATEKAKTANAKQQEYKQAKKEYKEVNREALAARRNRAIKIGAAAAGTALAAYGAYKLNKYVKTKNGQIAAKRGYDYYKKIFEGNKTIEIGSRLAAKSEADIASRDNLRAAAKNVMNYRRENGRGSLKKLPPLSSYNIMQVVRD